MAITKSAKKALRQSKRRQIENDKRSRALRDAVKRAKGAAKQGGEKAAETLSSAYQAIDKALKRGLIKKNTAARKKARVAKLFKAK